MSKNVGGTPAWTTNARTAHGLRHDHGDGTVAGEWTKRCAGPNKKRVVVDGLPAILDISDERIANLLGHRQQGLAAALSDNAKGCVLPIQVAEAEPQNIAGAKTDAGEQEQNRAVSETRLQGGAACGNDSLDFLGLQKPRQGRKAPVCERGNACVEARCALSIRNEITQERSHGGGAPFPGCPAAALACILNKLPETPSLELARVIS